MKALRVVLCVLIAVVASAQTGGSLPAPERSLSVNVMRMLNTAQMNYYGDAKHFATWDELRPLIAKWKAEGNKAWAASLTLVNTESNDDPFPGWKLRVMVSPDGKHYSLSLRNNEYCDVNTFSDEVGVIYTGTALGCEKTLGSKEGQIGDRFGWLMGKAVDVL
jgi:hypothetical protein